MRNLVSIILAMAIGLTGTLTGCRSDGSIAQSDKHPGKYEDAVSIVLSDGKVTVDGKAVSADSSSGVYVVNDIVYYPEGKDFTFGEGTEADAHSAEEAAKHTVVHITKPGEYVLSGKMSYGQIAVDLGEDAEDNPDAKVTLILNGVDINCDVAPAVIFYNVYECGEKDRETAAKDVDTSDAGANVLIADGTVNNVEGSYVARIYKSVELNRDGTEVVDSKKLHKYDAAFYSKMSMNINGGEKGDGVLNIKADNEGLDSELHLTLNGGNINIESGNDGINTNEDYISVTTLNGGNINITVNGSTGEGDGIDSNGWLVINGGTLTAAACGFSGDAGIDSDMGIHISGGEIAATGNMLDRISESTATYAVFSFADRQTGGKTYTLKNESSEVVGEYTPANDFSYLIISSEKLVPGTYTLWCGETQLAATAGEGGGRGGFGGPMPGGQRPQRPEGEMPVMPEGQRPEMPEGTMPAMPEGQRPQRPEGGMPGMPFGGNGSMENIELNAEFIINEGENYFNFVSEYTK